MTLSPEPPDTLSHLVKSGGVTCRTLGMTRIAGFVYGRSELAKAIDMCQPDILHAQGIRSDRLLASLITSLDIPVVTTQRNDPLVDYPGKFGSIRGSMMAKMHIGALRRLPTVVACSSAIAERAEAYGIATRVIRNGVDEDWFRPVSEEDRVLARKGLGLPLSGRLLVTTGSLIVRKRVGLLLHALSFAENVVLLIVGAGPLEAELKSLAQRICVGKRVVFKDSVEDVRPLLWASDAFVSASGSEGLPNAVLEAMAVGLPVLLSDIPPHREILRADSRGIAGQLFEGEEPSVIGRQMAGMPIGQVQRNASRSLVEQAFSARATAARYAAMYDELVGVKI